MYFCGLFRRGAFLMAWEVISFSAYCGKDWGLVSGVVWLLLDPFLWMGHTYLVAGKIWCVGGAAFLYMYGGPPCMMHHETARCMQCTTTNWSAWTETSLCVRCAHHWGHHRRRVLLASELHKASRLGDPLLYRAGKTFSSALMVSRVAT